MTADQAGVDGQGIDPTADPRFAAAVDIIGRTGAKAFQVRYSDDEAPVVWFAVALYEGEREGQVVGEADAALDPVRAILRLAERLVDGGTCTHCGRPSGLDPDSIEVMPLDEHICWYQFDPELATFRRACE